jgi:hypothetical protein
MLTMEEARRIASKHRQVADFLDGSPRQRLKKKEAAPHSQTGAASRPPGDQPRRPLVSERWRRGRPLVIEKRDRLARSPTRRPPAAERLREKNCPAILTLAGSYTASINYVVTATVLRTG